MAEQPDAVRLALDDLVDGVRTRDPDALGRAYDLTADLLASLAFGLLRDRAAAEDAVQEAWVRFVAGAEGFRGDGRALRAWLVRTTRNVCIDVLRRARFGLVDHEAELPDVADGPPGPTAAEVGLEGLDPDLERALASLTVDQRVALLLRHVEGLDGNEIGAALGRNRAAVYALLRRAERQMRRALAEPSDPGAVVRPQDGPAPR